MAKPRATRGFRLHVGLVGRRNVGKSSLINALMRQDVAIVSETPGTTTDPVTRPMELQPIGPVLLIDTAGVDDSGDLGTLRVGRTRNMLDRCDVGLLVCEAGKWSPEEDALRDDLRRRGLPTIVVFNKSDQGVPDAATVKMLEEGGAAVVMVSASDGTGLDELRDAIIAIASQNDDTPPPLLADLIGPGGLALLVVPIDKEAPVGRLIMPQVHAIRDVLDGDAQCMVVKESGLAAALDRLKEPPDLVVTDSQAFREVAAVTPPEVPMTGFSVLMSRLRGDLTLQVAGAAAIGRLKPGDRVLVAESCSHHPIEDDIGRVKLPRWLDKKAGGALQYDTVQGHDFPADLSAYALVVHCGACTMNRREMQGRLGRCRESGVPVTNYGLAIAYCFDLFDRALEPFPEALATWNREKAVGGPAID